MKRKKQENIDKETEFLADWKWFTSKWSVPKVANGVFGYSRQNAYRKIKESESKSTK